MATHGIHLRAWDAEVIVLRPPDLARVFALKENTHCFLDFGSLFTTDTGSLLIINDPHGEYEKFHQTDTFADLQLKTQTAIDDAPIVDRAGGRDNHEFIMAAGGIGNGSTIGAPLGWDIIKNLVLAKSTAGDTQLFSTLFRRVPGDMRWDLPSETNRIRQLGRIQAAPGEIWHQPGREPGEIFHQPDVGGNV